MAKARGTNAQDDTAQGESTEPVAPLEGEQPLDGMPEPDAGAAEDDDDKAKRPQVPKEMRPLFNEVARLSGFLSLARRAIYDGDPARAAKALALLERSVPDAREIAEMLAP